MIPFGVKARDRITGFTGIVTAHYRFITGCDQYNLQPEVDAEGKIPPRECFDEYRLEVIDATPKWTDPRKTVTGPAPG